MWILIIIPAITACLTLTDFTTLNLEVPVKVSKSTVHSVHKHAKENTCESCDNKSCPEDTIPPYGPIEYPSSTTVKRLNDAILLNFEREAFSTRDISIRLEMMEDIKNILTPVFPFAQLSMFGSTLNGFGLKSSSDVDICLSLPKLEYEAPSEYAVLETVYAIFKSSEKFSRLLYIPARVHIVNFLHIDYGLKGDISFCSPKNALALNATSLMRRYVNLDDRVAPLGLFLKKLVKLCDMGGAATGSLSSTGWMYLIIYFLQNHSPPVLPVLHEGSWNKIGNNTESVGHLWLAFLNYYVESFNIENIVVTITQSDQLHVDEKSWYTNGITMEDPFDESDNLGGRMTRRKTVRIFKTLQKFRQFYQQSMDDFIPGGKYLGYYLNVTHFWDGTRLPFQHLQEQCRLCDYVTHFGRNCTSQSKPN